MKTKTKIKISVGLSLTACVLIITSLLLMASYSKPTAYKVYKDSYEFMGFIMCAVAVIGMFVNAIITLDIFKESASTFPAKRIYGVILNVLSIVILGLVSNMIVTSSGLLDPSITIVKAFEILRLQNISYLALNGFMVFLAASIIVIDKNT